MTNNEAREEIVDAVLQRLASSQRRGGGGAGRWDRLAVERVDLVESDIVVRFTSSDRPGCRFGYRFPAIDADDPDGPLEAWAAVLVENLRELVDAADLGLPEDCGDEVRWLT